MSNIVRIFEEDIYVETDGYHVLDTPKGFVTADHLRKLANELDKRNESWNEQLNELHNRINSTRKRNKKVT